MGAGLQLSRRIHSIQQIVYPLAAMLSDQPTDHLEGREFHILTSARRQATELAEKVDDLHELSEKARVEAESADTPPSLPSDLDPEELMRALYRTAAASALIEDASDCQVPNHKRQEIAAATKELNRIAGWIVAHFGYDEDTWMAVQDEVNRRVKKRKGEEAETEEVET